MGSSDVRPIAKPPAIEVQDSDEGNTDEEHRLIAGYIILKGGGRTRRLWMAVTDVGVSVEDEKGVKERWSADAIRDATRIDASSKMTPRGQYGVMLRIEPTAPQNPDGGATLRRQASSTSADLLGLLSPLWGGRRRVLTPGRPRTPSSRRLSGGFGMGSPSAAKPPPKSLEYTLILPTSWEADAWAAAIGDTRDVSRAASKISSKVPHFEGVPDGNVGPLGKARITHKEGGAEANHRHEHAIGECEAHLALAGEGAQPLPSGGEIEGDASRHRVVVH